MCTRLMTAMRFAPELLHQVSRSFTSAGGSLPILTRDKLLADSVVTETLEKYGIDAQGVLQEKSARVAILARMSEMSGRPVASNALAAQWSTYDAATWFEKQCYPGDVQPHARNILDAQYEGAPPLEPAQTNPERVQGAIEENLPSNLSLDPGTFKSRKKLVLVIGRNDKGKGGRYERLHEKALENRKQSTSSDE